MSNNKASKPLVWLGNSLAELRKFPDLVQDEMGYALYQAQIGKNIPRLNLSRVLKEQVY